MFKSCKGKKQVGKDWKPSYFDFISYKHFQIQLSNQQINHIFSRKRSILIHQFKLGLL